MFRDSIPELYSRDGASIMKEKPSPQEWCENCFVYQREIPVPYVGCCRSTPDKCPRFFRQKGSCFSSVHQIEHFNTQCGRPYATPFYPQTKNISSWICPECQVHTDTEVVSQMGQFVKRKCRQCQRVFFGRSFLEETEQVGV